MATFKGQQVSHRDIIELIENFEDSLLLNKVSGEQHWLDGRWRLLFDGPWSYVVKAETGEALCTSQFGKLKVMVSPGALLWLDSGTQAR